MDIFSKINWYTSLSDIVDDQFVDGERLEKESVLYRTLRGSFTDAFIDLADDFLDQVTENDLISAEVAAKVSQQTKAKIKQEPKTEEKNRPYVPGIVKTDVRFPRSSSLSAQQHAICVRLITQIAQNIKFDKEEANIYLGLKDIINRENTEYLEIAKAHWDPSNIKIVNDELINQKWKAKIEHVNKLPRYYLESDPIPFTSEKEINMCFNETVLEIGVIPTIMLPQLDRRYNLITNSVRLRNQYFTNFAEKNLVTRDANCYNIAKSHDIDLVISTSGLKCLVNNLDSSHKVSWTLPIQVKNIKGKNVVFIDKTLPPTSSNALKKNNWMYKYILRAHFLRADGVDAVNFNNTPYNDPDQPEEDNLENSFTPHPPDSNTNFSYNIYTVGACGAVQNEMMKNKVEKDYKILVRTKIDGTEKVGDGEFKCLQLVPKLEHQLSLGAEASTLEEVSKQWASLAFRPDTSLIRVRIDTNTSEIIQYEHRTPLSVNNEMKRLYNVKGEDSLHIIYNVASEMTKMTPGNYLLRHTFRNGAFAIVYKETETAGKNTFDVQSLYVENEFPTIPNPPWPAIDTLTTNPLHIYFQRMPAMFYPSKRPVGNNQGAGKRGRPPGPFLKSQQKRQKVSNHDQMEENVTEEKPPL